MSDDATFREVLAAGDAQAERVIAQATRPEPEEPETYEIPARLQRDTPEETLALVAKTLWHQDRLLGKQGSEIGQLRELVASYEAQANTVPLPEADDNYGGWDDYSEPARTTNDLLRTATDPNALHAAQSLLANAIAQQAPAALQGRQEATWSQAWELATRTNPEVQQRADEIAQMLAADQATQHALQTGNPVATAGQIGAAFTMLASKNAHHQMKLAAQSASGATGRLDPVGSNTWDEIRSARTGKLEL